MVNKKRTTVAIIGTGASGVACFIQLVIKYIISSETNPLSIILFEKREEFGPGLAYGTGQEGHLLNTRAGLMGIFPEEPLHFVQWMQAHQEFIKQSFGQHSIHADAYPPRMLYGTYLKAMLDQYLQEAKECGITVDKIQTEIIDAETRGDALITLKSRESNEYVANFVILATGNPKSNNFTHLQKSDSYISSPWPSKTILTTITDKQADVGIVGSSLTAFDALITLVENQHRGMIYFFSLEGLLPGVKPSVEPRFDRKILTLPNIRKLIREQQRPLHVKDLIRLFRAEVEQQLRRPLDWAAEERRGKDQLCLLKADIQQALDGGNIFYHILYSLRHQTYAIWKLLAREQKLLFSKWVKKDIDIIRHAMPLENGLKLKRLLEAGQLHIIGYSDDIKWNGQQFVLKTNDGTSRHVDFVINASGPAVSIKKMDDMPLLRCLLERGYIVEYEAGGLLADLNTMRILAPARTNPSPFYAIGHPLIGLQHDVNALWFNISQADRLVGDLIKQLKKPAMAKQT